MKKPIFHLLAIIAIASMPFFQGCKPSNTTAGRTLQFNLQKGKTYEYEMVLDFDQTIMGQKSKTSMMTDYTVNVLKDDGQIKTLSFAYSDFKMDMNVMGMELHVDTGKPDASLHQEDLRTNPMGVVSKIFSSIKNKQFVMDVNKEGEVVNVKGMDALVNTLADSLGLTPDMKEKMIQSAKQQFNDEEIKQQFMPIFFIFPGKEVKQGDSWVKSYETKGRMPAKNTTTYTVREFEGNHVTLDVVTKITGNGDNLKIDGENKGTMVVESQSGMVVNSELNIDMTAKSNGVEVKMEGKTKTRGSVK